MHNDSAEILNDILSRFHHYMDAFRPTRGNGVNPMFRDTPRPRGGQTVDALLEDDAERGQMQAVEFAVGNMADPYRTAIYMLARNCYTGRNVWISNRLPSDALERAQIVGKARTILTEKLMQAGAM